MEMTEEMKNNGTESRKERRERSQHQPLCIIRDKQGEWTDCG